MTVEKPDLIQSLVDEILQSKKYRDQGLPASTVRSMITAELPNYRSPAAAMKAVRTKLHHVMAPYLGDPDYPAASQELSVILATGQPEALHVFCEKMLASHASTRERLQILDEFYSRLFAHTGVPNHILDLACGLNPFSLPWMGLPAGANYSAYDIHQPRVDLINQFLTGCGLVPLAHNQDILLEPPHEDVDVAFLFKEAHRMEERQRGCSLPLWQAVKTKFLLVSLPASSLSGRYQLANRQRQLVYGITNGQPWRVSEELIGTELVFIIDKRHDA
jgi:16S rRNA (guanine(1405)-N(7))-methyltransferase